MSLRDKLNDTDLLISCWNRIYSSKQEFKKTTSKGPDKISIQDYKDNEDYYLAKLVQELKTKKFIFSKLYGIAIKKQEKKKYRLIAVSNINDRIVHKAMLNLLNPLLYNYINTGVSYCGVKNLLKRNDKNSLNTKRAFLKIIEHIRNKKFYVFKADIKGFYDNVPKNEFLKLFTKLSEKIIKDNTLNPLIKEITYFELSNLQEFKGSKASLIPKKDAGISQGSALSQFFANIYLADFDNKMKKRYDDRYLRYIDDFIVFCDTIEEARAAKEYANTLLKQKKLELSPDSIKTKITNIKKDYVIFLGIRIDANQLSYKKNRKETQRYILSILDEHNPDLYRRYKYNKSKIIQAMNNKIKGIGEYLSFYHTQDTYNEINKWIKTKKHGKFKKLSLLNRQKIKPIIPINEWQSLFK